MDHGGQLPLTVAVRVAQCDTVPGVLSESLHPEGFLGDKKS